MRVDTVAQIVSCSPVGLGGPGGPERLPLGTRVREKSGAEEVGVGAGGAPSLVPCTHLELAACPPRLALQHPRPRSLLRTRGEEQPWPSPAASADGDPAIFLFLLKFTLLKPKEEREQ